MNKLTHHTPDLTAANIENIAALFPNCVTETKDDQGKLKRAIDFDLLRQELSPDLVEGPQERYRLDWPGKREALALANTPVNLTLRPCREESVDFENTQNLYIEGDNLDALKLLQETYLGKVKMIYIDPPYNTGNDFIYDDNFSMGRDEYEELSGDRDEHGNAMFVAEKWKQNSSSNGRFHSEWLSMMYPRLKLARNLLREDGIIAISIDENELQNLWSIGKEIFGSENFIEAFVYQKKSAAKGVPPANMAVSVHEYIVCFQMSSKFSFIGIPRSIDGFSNPDNDPRGPWRNTNCRSTVKSSLDAFEVVDPKTGISYKDSWAHSKSEMERMAKDGVLIFPKTHTGQVRKKEYYNEFGNPNMPVKTWLGLYDAQENTAALETILGGKVFQNSKNTRLLYDFFSFTLKKTDLILDFFSGSATTAHAVMQLNAEDGGKRRHIMVQLPEPCDEKSEAFKAGYKTIAEIGKERIRRAGKKILEEWQAKQAKEQSAERDLLNPQSEIRIPQSPPDIGFRVLKISDSNFRDIQRRPDELDQKELALHTEHIKPDRTPEDLLFQVLVDWGVDLALPIVSETLHDKRVFFVDDTALAACFDTGLSEDLFKEIAARKPLRAVFRDEGYGDDSTRINVEQIFKLLSPGTEVKSL